MNRFIFLIVTFLFFSNFVFGCSLALNPISAFDMGHYIFIGEVVEIIETNNPKTNQNKSQAIGLKVKVLENVFSTKKSSLYEVYPMRLEADCSLTSDTDELRERFPVGSQVRVIAKAAEVLRNQPAASSAVQLETSIYNRGSIARNDLREDVHSSADSVFDYKKYAPIGAKTKEEFELLQSSYDLAEFELRKDLLRLKYAKSEEERAEILERLVYVPHFVRLDFLKLAQTNLKNKDKLTALEKKWNARLDEFLKRIR